MSIFTDLPLHEVVLKIMFYENVAKATEMTPEDVLWRIDNAEISERQVREVLEWLVREKKVTCYLGKYSLDRVEFLEQKKMYDADVQKGVVSNTGQIQDKTPNRKTFYITSTVKHPKFYVYLIAFALLVLGYLTYTFSDFNYVSTPYQRPQKLKKSFSDSLLYPRRLYLSKDEEYTEEEKKAILYSFVRQNRINRLHVETFNKFHFVLDSVALSHKKEIRRLQSKLRDNALQFNSVIKKIIFSNVLIMVLFVFFLLRKKSFVKDK